MSILSRSCLSFPSACPIPFSKPFHALSFTFAEPFPEEGCRSRRVSVTADRNGVLDVVMMTWDLDLDDKVTYSTR